MPNAFLDRFSRTMIINLPDRYDRRQEIEAELRQQGAAIDGERVSLFPAMRPETAGAFPSIGARGCFLSHLNLLKAARDSSVETLLLLEDDAHFGRSFQRFHRVVLDALATTEWDIFYAGHRALAELVPTGPVTRVPPDLSLLTAHAVGFRQPVIARAIPFLEAMLERPQGSPQGGPMHVDGAYNWMRRAHPAFRTFAATPQIITQRASQSDITPRTGWRAGSPIANVLRRLRNHLA